MSTRSTNTGSGNVSSLNEIGEDVSRDIDSAGGFWEYIGSMPDWLALLATALFFTLVLIVYLWFFDRKHYQETGEKINMMTGSIETIKIDSIDTPQKPITPVTMNQPKVSQNAGTSTED